MKRLLALAVLLLLLLSACGDRRYNAAAPARPLTAAEAALLAEVADAGRLAADDRLAQAVAVAFEDYWDFLGARVTAHSSDSATVVVVEVDDLGAQAWASMNETRHLEMAAAVLTYLNRRLPHRDLGLLVDVEEALPVGLAVLKSGTREVHWKEVRGA